MEIHKIRIHTAIIFVLCFLIAVGFVAFWLRIAISKPEELTNVGFIVTSIVFLVFVGPPIVLTTTYFLHDFRKTISIDKSSGVLFVKKHNEHFKFNKEKLKEVYHVKVNKNSSSRYQFPMYEYLLFVFEERQKLVVTNLLCKPDTLIRALHITPKVIHTHVPLIDKTMGNTFLTTKEFDAKVKEFYHAYQNKSEAELLDICKQKGYADFAKKAARLLLNEKNNTTD
ncbi:hypothetical protein D1614_17750 [Maribellus luteus]|uniref:PH domain-containing protein n=1 Tax=Maribellus luteus TaxID=2305463 RepID=A0A399SVF4_9BACT|nr:hypothetical protein [Maribellus luteus]RIJ46769.1 hypothetical protein D1614_17750 [Maribellus luteus]